MLLPGRREQRGGSREMGIMHLTDEQRLAAGAVGVNLAVLAVMWCNRARLLHWVEVALFALLGKRGKGSIFLEDGFKPVDKEVLQQDLKVEGTLPAALNGVFARTGPNPHVAPVAGYHWCAQPGRCR